MTLQYSPTHTIVRGTLKGLICEVADFCALVKEKRASRASRQNACASLFWHDRGAAADAKGVKSTTTIQEPSVATGCLQTVITEAKREALAPFGFDDIVVKFSTRPEKLASRTQRKQNRLFSLLRRSADAAGVQSAWVPTKSGTRLKPPSPKPPSSPASTTF